MGFYHVLKFGIQLDGRIFYENEYSSMRATSIQASSNQIVSKGCVHKQYMQFHDTKGYFRQYKNF